MEVNFKLATFKYALGIVILFFVTLIGYSLAHAQSAPNITGIYNEGNNLIVDCYNCLGANKASNTGTLNKRGGGSASVNITAKNPSDSGDEGGKLTVPSSLGAKYADYLQLCTSSGCSNFIYVSAGATKEGDIKIIPQTGQSEYVKTPPPAEISQNPTCTLQIAPTTPSGQSVTNGGTLEITEGEAVSASLTLSTDPPFAIVLPKIDWGNGEIQQMRTSSAGNNKNYIAVNNSFKIVDNGKIEVKYPYCSNNTAIIYTKPKGKYDCSLHIFKFTGSASRLEDEVTGGTIDSGSKVYATLNINGTILVTSQSVKWGDMGQSPLLGLPERNTNRAVYNMDPAGQYQTLSTNQTKTITVSISDPSMCKIDPSVALTIAGSGQVVEAGVERTIKLQVTDIYDEPQAVAAGRSQGWTDNQCGNGFANFHPRCKVFNIKDKKEGNLILEAEGSPTDRGFWTFTKESTGWLCVRYISNKPNRWDIKCTQVFGNANNDLVRLQNQTQDTYTTPTPAPSPTNPFVPPTPTPPLPSPTLPIYAPSPAATPITEVNQPPSACTPGSCSPGQICSSGVCIADPDDLDIRE